MNEIKVLDKITIDKIAAGEVIERPVNVVKELVENSIDAGATSISVQIVDGGKTMIRITDNGCGIPKNQIQRAFYRHATSKIQVASDLSSIKTLGFRGEALSSIAAVSKLEILSKVKESVIGTKFEITGGKEEKISEIGLPNGTTIIVKDLFYNTPARIKFLKTPQTEASYIYELIEKIALSHPEIAFKLSNSGQLKLSTTGNKSLKDVIYTVFGKDITSNLLPINGNDEILSISGYIGRPEIARANRNLETCFINGRYVKDKIVFSAIEEAYKGFQMKNSFPFALVNIKIQPDLIDVNVHPTKMEIRFFDNEKVYDSIFKFVRQALIAKENIPNFTIGQKELVPEKTLNIIPPKPSKVPEPFEAKRATTFFTIKDPEPAGVNNISYEEKAADYDILEEGAVYNTDNARQMEFSDLITEDDTNSETLISENKRSFFGKNARPFHRIVGEIFNTYWIVEYEESMYVIDQHAAHEKVIYERFMNNYLNHTHDSQNISPSIVVTLNAKEEATLEKFAKEFEHMGFVIDYFGGNEYTISAVPLDMENLNSATLFLSFLDEMSLYTGSMNSKLLMEHIAGAACKAAVKGGNRISLMEADALIDELLNLDNPYNCPHGRPTIIKMSKSELEKKFKRII